MGYDCQRVARMVFEGERLLNHNSESILQTQKDDHATDYGKCAWESGTRPLATHRLYGFDRQNGWEAQERQGSTCIHDGHGDGLCEKCMSYKPEELCPNCAYCNTCCQCKKSKKTVSSTIMMTAGDLAIDKGCC